jgi:hypothetical protein
MPRYEEKHSNWKSICPTDAQFFKLNDETLLIKELKKAGESELP